MKETPKAPREQAPRDAKLLSTVEHSTTSTPAAGADSDSDWSNSSERLEELDSSMSTQTPHRRSPRHRPSSNSSAEFSSTEQCIGSSPSTRLQRPPLHEISGNAVKREGTASRDRSVIRPRSMSPSGYNKEIRDRKMQAEGLVELPPTEWRYQQYMRIKEEKKNAKRLWKDELRKQKGKEPERALEGNAGVPSKALGKKKAKADRKPQKARKRQKKSHKRVKEEPIDVDVGLQPVKNAASRSEHPPLDPRRDQSGKSALSKKQSKMTIHEDSHPEAVVLQSKSEVLSSRSKRSAPKSSDKEMLPQRSTASGYIRTGPRSWLANQTQISRPWQQAGNRREWSKAESSSAPNGKENENGTSNAIGCPGDWLSSSRYAKPSRDTCALYNRIGQREKGLSSEQMTRGRQQSSIEPKSFYGKQPECRVTPTLDSSPSITDKGLTNENKHRDAEQSTAKDIMTPPDAPPASKGSNNRRKSMSVHVPLESNVEADWRPMFDNDVPLFPTSKSSILNQNHGSADSVGDQCTNRRVVGLRTESRRQILSKDHHLPTVPEDKVVERISKEVSESPKGRPQPRRSFNAQRSRHQSVPADLGRRNTTGNEQDSSPRFEQQRHDDALQELSKNSILMNRKLDSLLLERFPPTTNAQAATVRPATTPTAAASAEGGNLPEQSERRKRRRPSAAERKLRLPELDHYVPMELRLPDENLIEIGRIVNGYERHKRAHYCFSWRGGLRAGYTRLLAPSNDDRPVWTAEEINRVRR